MHPVMRSDFLNCLLFLDRLQRDSCFHFGAEVPPLPRSHSCSVSEAAILHLIAWSEFRGAPQPSWPRVLYSSCSQSAGLRINLRIQLSATRKNRGRALTCSSC